MHLHHFFQRLGILDGIPEVPICVFFLQPCNIVVKYQTNK